jgi:bacterioferritin-associated ferredoxin
MYICSCHAVTDGRIRKAAQTGEAKTWKELTRLTGCSTQCGTCARDAKAIFDRAVAEMHQSAVACQSQTACNASCKNCPFAMSKPEPEPEV